MKTKNGMKIKKDELKLRMYERGRSRTVGGVTRSSFLIIIPNSLAALVYIYIYLN